MKRYKLVIIPMQLMSGNKVIIEHDEEPTLIRTIRPLMANGLVVGKKVVVTRVLTNVSARQLNFDLFSATGELLGKAKVQEVK